MTVLALYLFDEAWTEYRYQIRVATQNVDVIGEDPYKVVYFTDIPKTASMSEAEQYAMMYQWMKELEEDGTVKFAGSSMQFNFLFNELKMTRK